MGGGETHESPGMRCQQGFTQRTSCGTGGQQSGILGTWELCTRRTDGRNDATGGKRRDVHVETLCESPGFQRASSGGSVRPRSSGVVADTWASAASTTRLAPQGVDGEVESGDDREELEEVEVGEEGEEFEEDGEEVGVARGRRAPRGPTQMGRESHELTRLPYRAWCSHCARGCGEKTPHRGRGGESEEEKRHMAPRMVLN